jgi:hypothetical protein
LNATAGRAVYKRARTRKPCASMRWWPRSVKATEGQAMARFMWGSAATLLVVALVLLFFALRNVGQPPMLLFNPSLRLVDEGVAMVMVCGEQPTGETVNKTAAEVVRYRWTGERWSYRHRQGDCIVYYQHPRNAE